MSSVPRRYKSNLLLCHSVYALKIDIEVSDEPLPKFSGFSVLITTEIFFFRIHRKMGEPGQRSRYSNWLRAGLPKGRSSSPGGGKICLPYFVQTAYGTTKPPVQWVVGALSPGIKRQELEADHMPSTSTEIMKTCTYPSTSTHVFMA
jgi:hypothetical protein